jgi:hypothetical protein
MSRYYGDFLPAKTIRIGFNTVNASGTLTALSSGAVMVSKDGVDVTPSGGVTLTASVGSVTGYNTVVVDTSVDTTTFTAGSEYAVRLSGSSAVGGSSVSGVVVGEFSLANRSVAVDSGGKVLLQATQTGVTIPAVTTVGSVTGSVGSITGVTFPTNFSVLAIAASTGQVGIDLTNIKQATTSTTLNNITIPTVTSVTGSVGGNVAGSVGSVTGLTTSAIAAAILASPSHPLQTDGFGNALVSMTQAVSMTGNTANSVGDCLNAARAQGFGRWALAGTTLTLYGSDNSTVVRTFTLDSSSAPTQRS